MEDSKIVDLYWRRDENAIRETSAKYGAYCHTIAMNILSIREDAQECVNDTYQQAWVSMPPQRPKELKPWLGKVVRNISINLWNKNHRQKRYNGMELLLEELEECIPSSSSVENQIEAAELGKIISNWLRTLSDSDQQIFIWRYWKCEAVNEIAGKTGNTPAKIAQRMYRLRLNLKLALEKEGVYR